MTNLDFIYRHRMMIQWTDKWHVFLDVADINTRIIVIGIVVYLTICVIQEKFHANMHSLYFFFLIINSTNNRLKKIILFYN